jgi:ABC-2 type transport system ATP-binding protein
LIRTLAGEGTTVLLSSHYMDEVEALAKSVAVLRRGSVVASGSPVSLGGRDRGQVTIRFTLPAGVAHSDLPVAPTRSNGTSIEIITTDEITVLNQITGWALQRKEALMGLDVTRTTLEDVYIALTHEESNQPEGATHD